MDHRKQWWGRPERWRKTAHSTGDRESASREAAALCVGTHTLQTWATAAGMKEVGNEAKKPSRVAATSCGVAVSGICIMQWHLTRRRSRAYQHRPRQAAGSVSRDVTQELRQLATG